jgi:DNA primase
MTYLREDVDKLLEAADLVQLISEFTPLKKVGRRYVGRCPFHKERTPSFTVNVEQGFYYCFGCRESGDAITFVRKTQGLDFAEAVEFLANKSNISISRTYTGDENARKTAYLVSTLDKAISWYHELLLKDPEAGLARDYLRKRGIDKQEVVFFKLGWAPIASNGLSQKLKIKDNYLIDTGLSYASGGLKDFFRARIIFPIYNAAGKPVAIGGRILPVDLYPQNKSLYENQPKYKNSKETALYQKSKTLYGLNWAKSFIVKDESAVICEGYTDVILFHKCGIKNAVATCGTALSEDHIKMLSKYTKTLIFAFDSDEAGSHAAERIYSWQKEFDVEMKVAVLPEGKDPAQLALEDPDLLKARVLDSVAFLDFKLYQELKHYNLSTPNGKSGASKAGLALIASVKDDLLRDQYIIKLSDIIRVDPDILRKQLKSNRDTVDRPAASVKTEKLDPESEALKLVIQNPEEISDLFDPILFSRQDIIKILEILQTAPSTAQATLEIQKSAPQCVELFHKSAVEECTADPLDVMCRLIESACNRKLSELKIKSRTGEDPFELAAAKVSELKREKENLRNPRLARTSAKRLLELLKEP